jgi:hypothetical protein
MAALVLTVASTILCQHGGSVALSTSNTTVSVQGSKALVESDIHQVSGCPFWLGQKYSPCVRIEWSAGSSALKAGGTPVLIATSVGNCYGAENAVQGIASKVPGQSKVMA